ncbi:MAG: sigma-70 family RNA polymerase sigma factor [Nibricoccus sp.]
MSTTLTSSLSLAECLDIVDTAAATITRRLPAHVSQDDLISVGKLALISALSHCEGSADEVRAYSFVRVRGAMLDELRRLDPLSRAQREKTNRVLRVQAELSGRFGRAATRAEIAAATQLSVCAVVEILNTIARDSEFPDFDLGALADDDTPSPAEVVETDDLRASLRDALQRLLNANQALVLQRYYFDDATLEVIASELGVSKERVRQIREAGEKKLRADFAVLAIWQSLLTRDND